MRLQKAPLVLKEFFVLESNYQFNDPGDVELNIREVFDEYTIDFDFRVNKEDNEDYYLYTKIAINQPVDNTALPGYLISLESLTVLNFNTESELNDKQRKDFIYMSGLSIAINNLRAYILNLTSYYPFGRYQLPAIDMVQLHKDKREQLKESKNKSKE